MWREATPQAFAISKFFHVCLLSFKKSKLKIISVPTIDRLHVLRQRFRGWEKIYSLFYCRWEFPTFKYSFFSLKKNRSELNTKSSRSKGIIIFQIEWQLALLIAGAIISTVTFVIVERRFISSTSREERKADYVEMEWIFESDLDMMYCCLESTSTLKSWNDGRGGVINDSKSHDNKITKKNVALTVGDCRIDNFTH